MTTVNMTRQATFIKQGGGRCPVCQSDCIEGVDGFESDTHEAWREIECKNCGSAWHDIYQLSGYEIIRTGENYEPKERSNEVSKQRN